MQIDEIYNKALEQFNQGQYESSIELCNQIVQKNQNHPFTWNLLGNIFFKLNDLETAKNFFVTALNQKQDFIEAYYMLGNTLFSANMFNEAIGIWQEGLKYQEIAIIYSNIAAAFIKLKDKQNASLNAKKAIELDNRCEDAYNCLLNIAKDENDTTNIEKYIKSLLVLNPQNAVANFDYSYLFFKQGDLENGFKYFEYRKKLDFQKNKYAYLPFKEYEKQPLKDKHLLIYHEQGFGDNIQFARFLKEIKGDNISYGIQNSLNKLFSYNFPQIKFLKEIKLDESFDYSLASMSIPYAFDVKQIESKSYLTVNEKDIQKFKEKNQFSDTTKNIGLVYSGSKTSQLTEKKSLILKDFENLLTQKEVQFYSLQVDDKEQIKEFENIIDLGSEFKDFYDTAVAISALDLVISVDTAVAHLTGALGKNGLVLNKSSQFDFRWENKNGKSIWYDSLTVLKYENINEIINKINGIIDEL